MKNICCCIQDKKEDISDIKMNLKELHLELSRIHMQLELMGHLNHRTRMEVEGLKRKMNSHSSPLMLNSTNIPK